jgi:hypothetical protein
VRISSILFLEIYPQHYSITHPAATFGARGTPHSLKVIEVMGIEAGRRWGVCSLNELRKVCYVFFRIYSIG